LFQLSCDAAMPRQSSNGVVLFCCGLDYDAAMSAAVIEAVPRHHWQVVVYGAAAAGSPRNLAVAAMVMTV
jgi:hypothetical protein